MPSFVDCTGAITYTQVVNAREECQYTQEELTLNECGDFYFKDNCILPVEDDLAFPLDKFPFTGVHLPTNQEVDIQLTPATIRLVFIAYDMMHAMKTPKFHAALPPNMMVDPFTGLSVKRPTLVGRVQSGVCAVPPDERAAWLEKQMVKLDSLRYDKATPMTLPIPPSANEAVVRKVEHEVDVVRDQCESLCCGVMQRVAAAEEFAFDPIDVREKDMELTVEVIDAAEGSESDGPCGVITRFLNSLADANSDNTERVVSSDEVRGLLENSTHVHPFGMVPVNNGNNEDNPPVRIPPDAFGGRKSAHGDVVTWCSRSFGTPACDGECCNGQHRSDDLADRSFRELCQIQFAQYPTHVNRAGAREDAVSDVGFDPGRFSGAMTSARSAFVFSMSAAALTAEAGECESLLYDLPDMRFEDYTHNLSGEQIDLYDTLDYRDVTTYAFQRCRRYAAVAVNVGSLELRRVVAAARTFVHPIWLNDAIIGTATLFKGRLMYLRMLDYNDIDVHGFDDRDCVVEGDPSLVVRRFDGRAHGDDILMHQHECVGRRVFVIVPAQYCVVPLGPYTVVNIDGAMCLANAWLPPQWCCAPILDVITGCVVGITSTPLPVHGNTRVWVPDAMLV